jgi:NADPH:quinone reductase-like Zn-dependent oxidoreductase
LKIGITLPQAGQQATRENVIQMANLSEKEVRLDSLWVFERLLWPLNPQTAYPGTPEYAEQEAILVTGATGNVGSEVIKQLSKATTDVNIETAVHSVKNAKKVQGNGIDVVQIDYNKPETLKEALMDVDKLFFVPPDVPNACI